VRGALLWIAIAACASRSSPPTLSKADVRPTLKQLAQPLKQCFDERRAGVLNIRLAVTSEDRTTVELLGSDPDTLSPVERHCVAATLANADLARLEARGRLVLLYPFTFADRPPDNREIAVFDEANRAAAAQDWRAAFETSERGLTITSFDGPHRRRLIEVAGVAACHLGLGAKAQHYIELASPQVEPVVRETCKQAGTALPPNKSATH